MLAIGREAWTFGAQLPNSIGTCWIEFSLEQNPREIEEDKIANQENSSKDTMVQGYFSFLLGCQNWSFKNVPDFFFSSQPDINSNDNFKIQKYMTTAQSNQNDTTPHNNKMTATEQNINTDTTATDCYRNTPGKLFYA